MPDELDLDKLRRVAEAATKGTNNHFDLEQARALADECYCVYYPLECVITVTVNRPCLRCRVRAMLRAACDEVPRLLDEAAALGILFGQHCGRCEIDARRPLGDSDDQRLCAKCRHDEREHEPLMGEYCHACNEWCRFISR